MTGWEWPRQGSSLAPATWPATSAGSRYGSTSSRPARLRRWRRSPYRASRSSRTCGRSAHRSAGISPTRKPRPAPAWRCFLTGSRRPPGRSCTSMAGCTRSASDRPPPPFSKISLRGGPLIPILHLMEGSAAEIPASQDEGPVPGLRASDAERDQVVAKLRDEFVAGRLSHDTFLHRVNVVFESRRKADLPPLVADLPAESARGGLVGWLRGAWSRVTGVAHAAQGPPTMVPAPRPDRPPTTSMSASPE